MVEIKKKIVGMGSSFGVILDTVILDKFGLKKGDYVLIEVKRKIINPDVIERKMPIPVRIKTAFRTFDCLVIADTGKDGWLHTIQIAKDYKGNDIKDRQVFQMYDKSVIQEIQFLKKIPFELNSSIHHDIRRAQSHFSNQWKIKIPSANAVPGARKEFWKKINQIEEKKISKANVQSKNKKQVKKNGDSTS